MLTAEVINERIQNARKFLLEVVSPDVVNSVEIPVFTPETAAALQTEAGPYEDLVQAMSHAEELRADPTARAVDKVLAGLALAVYVSDMNQAKKLAVSIRNETDPEKSGASLTSLFGNYLRETSISPEVSGEDVFSVELE